MADKQSAVYPSDNVDDYWHTAVKVLTGYDMPQRDTLFNSLVGNNDIPLMRVEFDDHPGDIEEIVDNLEWRTMNSRPAGWRIQQTDFVVPFYSGLSGAIGKEPPVGTEVKLKRARITLIGNDEGDGPPVGGVVKGREFKSGLGKDFEGQSKDTVWSNLKLRQYSYGGGMALDELLRERNTQGFSWNGLWVKDDDAVDLESFEKSADAFDRVARFFKQRAADLRDWEFDLGRPEASWKGKAAGVFQDIVHALARNYRSYSEQFPLVDEGTKSSYGEALRDFDKEIVAAVKSLHREWDKWQELTGNPLRFLHDVLLEVTDDIWDYNIRQVGYKVGNSTHTTQGTTRSDGYHYVKGGSFTDSLTKSIFPKEDPPKGSFPLDEKETWKKIGEEAIRRWQQTVKDELVTAGKQAIIDVQNSLRKQDFPGKVRTESVNLSEKLATDQVSRDRADGKADKKRLEEEAKKKQDEAEKKQEQRQSEADRKREELERKQEEKQTQAQTQQA
ncbi:AAWKG family protein, partial [Streptomyces sp. NPDC055078]